MITSEVFAKLPQPSGYLYILRMRRCVGYLTITHVRTSLVFVQRWIQGSDEHGRCALIVSDELCYTLDELVVLGIQVSGQVSPYSCICQHDHQVS